MKILQTLLPLVFCLTCVVVGLGFIGNALAEDAGAVRAPAADASAFDAAASTPTPSSPSEAVRPEAKGGSAAGNPEGLNPAVDRSALSQFGELVESVKKGDWRNTIALVLLLLTSFLLWVSQKSTAVKEWLNKNDGLKVAAVGVVSGLGALGSAVAGEAPIDLDLFKAAGSVALTAMGAYGGLWKKVLLPMAGWVKSKLF